MGLNFWFFLRGPDLTLRCGSALLAIFKLIHSLQYSYDWAQICQDDTSHPCAYSCEGGFFNFTIGGADEPRLFQFSNLFTVYSSYRLNWILVGWYETSVRTIARRQIFRFPLGGCRAMHFEIFKSIRSVQLVGWYYPWDCTIDESRIFRYSRMTLWGCFPCNIQIDSRPQRFGSFSWNFVERYQSSVPTIARSRIFRFPLWGAVGAWRLEFLNRFPALRIGPNELKLGRIILPIRPIAWNLIFMVLVISHCVFTLFYALNVPVTNHFLA